MSNFRDSLLTYAKPQIKEEAAEAGNQSGSPIGCQREAFCAIELLSTHGRAKESSSEGKW